MQEDVILLSDLRAQLPAIGDSAIRWDSDHDPFTVGRCGPTQKCSSLPVARGVPGHTSAKGDFIHGYRHLISFVADEPWGSSWWSSRYNWMRMNIPTRQFPLVSYRFVLFILVPTAFEMENSLWWSTSGLDQDQERLGVLRMDIPGAPLEFELQSAITYVHSNETIKKNTKIHAPNHQSQRMPRYPCNV